MNKFQVFKNTFNKVVQKGRQASNCEICEKEFGITRLKHLCKRCNRIVCSSCGSARRTVVTFDPKVTHKVCPVCEKESHFQFTFRTMNKTKWGNMSLIGTKWIEKCDLKGKANNLTDPSYSELLKIATNTETEYKDFSVIEKDVLCGRSDREVFNYSMHEYLFYNQEGVSSREIHTQVSNVLKAFCVRYPNIGYCQGMNYIAVFLISLMDEESAFSLFSHVITKILPANFYSQTQQGSALMGLHQEKFVLCALAKDFFNLDDKETEKVKNFLDINAPCFLIPLFVNCVNFQTLFLTWNQMILSQSMNEIRKVTLELLEMLIDRIKSDTIEKSDELQTLILNRFSAESFENAQKINIDNQRVIQLQEDFKKEYSSKWVSNDAYVYYTLQKHTHFTKSEIKVLQEHYAKFVEANSQHEKSQEENKSENGSKKTHVEGVNKEQLKEIMKMLTEDDQKQDYLNSIDWNHMFEVFDLDQTGYLDFKEFLSCLSMLTRGNLDEKIKFAFEIFDQEAKGYLYPKQYDLFVMSILQAIKLVPNAFLDVAFEEELAKFEAKLHDLGKDKDKVPYFEIHKELLSDNFVESCDNAERARPRGETVMKIQQCLSYSPSKGTPETILEEEDEEPF